MVAATDDVGGGDGRVLFALKILTHTQGVILLRVWHQRPLFDLELFLRPCIKLKGKH